MRYLLVFLFLFAACSSKPKKSEKIESIYQVYKIAPSNGTHGIVTRESKESCVSEWNSDTNKKSLRCKDTKNYSRNYEAPSHDADHSKTPNHPAYSSPNAGESAIPNYLPPGYQPSDVSQFPTPPPQ